MPLRFTDATGALFYTEDGTATGGGDIMYMYYNNNNMITIHDKASRPSKRWFLC